MDLSHPAGCSVNDGVNGDDFTLSYARVDGAIDFIIQEGRGAILAKIDIPDANGPSAPRGSTPSGHGLEVSVLL